MEVNSIERLKDGGFVFTGQGVNAYACLALSQSIKLWRMHKIKVGRGFKITQALEQASRLTGKGPFKTDLKGMLDAEAKLKWRADFIKANLLD